MFSSAADEDLIKFSTNSKSGAIFVMSAHRHYIVKSATAHEKDLLSEIVPVYAEYLSENPDSMLARILCLVKLRINNSKYRFIIMANVDHLAHKAIELYDLKVQYSLPCLWISCDQRAICSHHSPLRREVSLGAKPSLMSG
jgi:hypothetical protein